MADRLIEKQYAIFILLFYLLIFQSPLSAIIPKIGYIDEMIAIIAVPIYVFELKKKNYILRISGYGYTWLIVLFLIVGILGNIIYQFQPLVTVALPSLFLSIKFWLAIYTGNILFRGLSIQKYASKIYLHIKFVIFLLFALFLLDNIFHIFPANIRYGMRSTQLFYGIPTTFSAICAFLFVLLTLVRPYVKRTRKYYVALILLMISTLRSKSFVVAFTFCIIYYFVYIKQKKVTLRKAVLCIPFVVLMVQNQINYYFFSDLQSDSARYQLLITSIKMLKDFFPIGAGFGTYGSYMSAKNYSPIYRMYGISHVYGLSKGAAYFVSDSYWPMIAGETGVIGLIAIIAILYLMIIKIQKIKRWNKAMYASGLMAIGYLLIVSMAESAFAHPNAIPFALVIGLIYGQDEKYSADNKEV